MIAATAITNVRVFDGERLREPATVVLEDATISARTSADGALNSDVVDGGRGTLLPGLIDTHVHVNKVSQNIRAVWIGGLLGEVAPAIARAPSTPGELCN